MAEESEMGTFSCRLEILSADGIRSETVEALVDTGSTYTCLPDGLLRGLGLVPGWQMAAELADGRIVYDSIGEARIRLEGKEISTVVTFVPDDSPILLGAYTLEGIGMGVDPARRRLVPAVAIRRGSSNGRSSRTC